MEHAVGRIVTKKSLSGTNDNQVEDKGSTLTFKLRIHSQFTTKLSIEFSLNVLNSVTKIFFITVKGLEPATQPPVV